MSVAVKVLYSKPDQGQKVILRSGDTFTVRIWSGINHRKWDEWKPLTLNQYKVGLQAARDRLPHLWEMA